MFTALHRLLTMIALQIVPLLHHTAHELGGWWQAAAGRPLMGEVVISYMCPSGLKAKPEFATIIKVFHARQMATIK